MRLITDYRYSRNHGKPLRNAIVGPKTFQKAKRSWFIKVLIELPCEVGARSARPSRSPSTPP